MKCFKKCVIMLFILEGFFPNMEGGKNERILLRKKRYLAFPEGAAFSAVWCLTSQMGITDGATIFSEGINWGLVYDLPNDTRPLLNPYKALQQRRNRRDLYVKVEDILTSFPQEPVLSDEPDDHKIYHWASQVGSRTVTDCDGPTTEECSDVFQCPFSLIDMALGYYSDMGALDNNYVY